MTYTTPGIGQIAKNIGVELEDIRLANVDADANIVMIGSDLSDEKSIANPNLSCTLRGSLFTCKNGVCVPLIVSAGWPEEITADHIDMNPIFVESDGEPSMAGFELKVGHKTFTMPTFSLTAGCEGLFIRRYKFRGKVYSSNHTKIDSTKSKGLQCFYGQTFEELGLPSDDLLFPPEKCNDEGTYPYCYNFMASKAGCVTGTRQWFKGDAGYITFLGVAQLGVSTQEDFEKAEYPYLGFKTFTYEDYPSVVDENLGAISPVVLTLEEANEHLIEGFYDNGSGKEYADDRLRTGEVVMLNIPGVLPIKIVPPCFHWRNSLVGGNPSPLNQFYKVVANNFHDLASYDEWFIRIGDIHMDTIKSHVLEDKYPLVWLDMSNERYEGDAFNALMKSVVERQRLAAINYILACPIHMQREAVDFYDEFVKRIHHLVQFLFAMKRDAIHFVDPNTLTTVGTALEMNVSDAPNGKVYQKGCDNRIFDVTEVIKTVPRYKTLAILAAPHPRATNILIQSTRDTKEKMNQKHGHAKQSYNKVLTNQFYRYINRETYNTLFQLSKQSLAYVDPPREPTVIVQNLSTTSTRQYGKGNQRGRGNRGGTASSRGYRK